MAEQPGPPPEWFDDKLAKRLIGKTLLVGITEQNYDESLIRRTQVFGTVVVADRSRGICLDRGPESGPYWLPPSTWGIQRAKPGVYTNRATGEVVTDPDYTGSWLVTAPKPKPARKAASGKASTRAQSRAIAKRPTKAKAGSGTKRPATKAKRGAGRAPRRRTMK
jgi:hypothetical protein